MKTKEQLIAQLDTQIARVNQRIQNAENAGRPLLVEKFNKRKQHLEEVRAEIEAS